MPLLSRLFPNYTIVDEATASRLQSPTTPGISIEVHPPRTDGLPAALDGLVASLLEIQSDWTGLRNTSPRIAWEIRRPRPERLRLQFTVPSRRLERKLRTQLPNEVPGVEFSPGRDGLPVEAGDTIGGGLLTTGRRDWYPLRTEFDQPPTNAQVAALHRDAMRQNRLVLQVLFQPLAGHPIRRWWWTRNAYKRVGELRNPTQSVLGDRPPTPRERNQAKAVEHKAANTRYRVSLRCVIMGAAEYTPSRVKEWAGSYNCWESDESGQYLDMVTAWSPLRHRLAKFAAAITDRQFSTWHRSFYLSPAELAPFLALPDRNQQNITYAQP